MQFGVREICDVVFKAKSGQKIGKTEFAAGEPVLYIDTAKTSTVEGAATTVYAQGGRGNSRLISWEGEKTLTFTVEDALLSEIGFAVLSGAGLLKAGDDGHVSYVHSTSTAVIDNGSAEGTYKIDLKEALRASTDKIEAGTPLFVKVMEHGSIGAKITGVTVDASGQELTFASTEDLLGKTVLVDYYVKRETAVTEMTIDAENFAGYYYVEASTLFKRQSDGKALPAELIFPNVKIQSNFTFSMASTGDPSTFTFTMDAMPGYTRFNRDKKVLCVMQVIDPGVGGAKDDVDSREPGLKMDDEIEYPFTVKEQ
jgi:hypothetical protein